ncbi:uncharacterized protein LOC119381154 [Rhipicephalus sanguineus]|uniref:uncharacterized protein LOC119381154 n=1 Tax=Rhipicephalus sanguineus TaxID=34632 RepID=UPI001895D01C|nr:uncharacterized protein LOC119381154 [Rhipicephalus sanguineus]
MAASRGLQDKIDAFEKKAENAAMAAENDGQQRAGAQPDSAAEVVAPASGSGNTADEPAATDVPRRHQLLARTLMKAFKSADKTSMGITTRSRIICGCPETPERGLLRRSRLRQAAGDGAATTQPSRQMIVLRGLVALAAFLAAASFLLSAMFLAQSLRSERTRQMQKVVVAPPAPKQAPVAYMPPVQEANAEAVHEKRHKRRHSRRRRLPPVELRAPASGTRQHEDDVIDAEDPSIA